MVKDVFTIKSGYSVNYAKSFMSYFQIECLVVLKDDEPVGIITNSDIKNKVNLLDLDPHLLLVDEIMSKPLFWVTPNTSLDEAFILMNRKNIKRLPVIGYFSNGPVLLGLLKISHSNSHERELESLLS
jgi:CBS domain-containing protein